MVIKDVKQGIGQVPVLCDSCIMEAPCRYAKDLRTIVERAAKETEAMPFRAVAYECDYYISKDKLKGGLFDGD